MWTHPEADEPMDGVGSSVLGSKHLVGGLADPRRFRRMLLRSLRAAVSATASLATVAGAMAVIGAASPASADEGMWTFDNFPIQTVNEKYGTRIDQAWLDRVRNASVRIQGCSASFVSDEGLILTNWH